MSILRSRRGALPRRSCLVDGPQTARKDSPVVGTPTRWFSRRPSQATGLLNPTWLSPTPSWGELAFPVQRIEFGETLSTIGRPRSASASASVIPLIPNPLANVHPGAHHFPADLVGEAARGPRHVLCRVLQGHDVLARNNPAGLAGFFGRRPRVAGEDEEKGHEREKSEATDGRRHEGACYREGRSGAPCSVI